MMIYTALTCEAMKLAYAAHHGQVDKSGIPYIFHPIHLAEQMQDEYTTCVALLHDVVEDTDVTLEELAKVFPPEVVEAVRLMTHGKDEPYLDYVRRVKENPIAKVVKLADLRHNSDESRMPDVNTEKLLYYRKKYAAAFAVLESVEE
jgi:(p)ppGpp synthase/HD superfamily hydrolase